MRLSGLSTVVLLSIAFLGQLIWAESAYSDSSPRAGAGRLTLEIRGDYLPDFGIEVRQAGQAITTRKRLHFRVESLEPIAVHAPRGIFESLDPGSGRLAVEPNLVIQRHGREVIIDKLLLVPGESAGHPRFMALDDRGNVLFTLSHMHVALETEKGRFWVTDAELEASAYLAQRLGFEALSGMPIGAGSLDLELDISKRSVLTGMPAACTDRPIWPQEGEEADITLIDMDKVVYQGTHSDERIKIAPSATLRNESQADVPWIRQFESLESYPYSPPDQHGYLVWNLYRITDGRIKMLAASGAKHAFFTVNQSCELNCDNNNVVWPGCEDIYSAGSNDMPEHQGPRNEIEASIGEWDNCGSFFDPECTGSQTDNAGQWQHRLLVDPAQLQKPDAQYLIDAWYVVQYDTNVWNTMGYRPINPEPSGSGWVMNPGPFSQGPAISQWVSEDSADSTSDHDVIVIPSETPDASYPDNMPRGHLRLLVKVTEIEPGRYRYNYALQNYDFDQAIEGFRLDLPGDATVFDTFFADVDSDAGNDWRVSVDQDYVLFQAPPGNALTWFTLFNFEIETDAPPENSRVRLDLCGEGNETEVETLAPASGTNLIFEDSFLGTSC